MANDRVIRIGAEFDASGVIKSINQIRQELSNVGVDTSLFKDINKDLDKISKAAISVNAALKNGIPEKDINSFLKSTSEASKLFGTLPDKIRQVSTETSNIRFPKEVTTRLTEIESEIERLGKEAKNALGEDLQKNLRNAIPRDIVDTKAIEGIVKAQDKAEAFNNTINKIQDSAQKATEKINSMVIGLANPKAINPTLSGNARTAAEAQNRASIDLSQRLSQSLSGGTLAQDQDVLTGLYSTLGKSQQQIDAFRNSIIEYVEAQRRATEVEQQRSQILDIINNAELTSSQRTQEIARLTQEGANLTNTAIQQVSSSLSTAANNATTIGQRASTSFNNVSNSVNSTNNYLQRQDSLLRQIVSRATSLIGVGAAFNYITRGVREAWQGIRDLDKEFTQIAVVTDKTTSQLWQSFGTYSQMAQGLGVTTKDAVATSALYYQQGLDTAEVMTLTSETIKMAQIAGMDFATATNQMTAALRGFNLEMDQAGAVNDIFSTLAANAAVSTEELAYALTKTASIADSAGMSIDTTSAFLTKMIETTREAPKQKLAA